MSWVTVCGIDPGPTPGLVALHIRDGYVYDVDLAQTSADLMPKVLGAIVSPRVQYGPVLIGVEKFVSGHRAARSSSAGAGAITRDMVGVIEACGAELGAVVVQRTAKVVKDWATTQDGTDRLKKAGLEVPRGMRHAADGARHALYAAVHAGHLPDPMSSRYKKPRLS